MTAANVGIISTRLDGTWDPNIEGMVFFDPTYKGSVILHSHPILQANGTAFHDCLRERKPAVLKTLWDNFA